MNDKIIPVLKTGAHITALIGGSIVAIGGGIEGFKHFKAKELKKGFFSLAVVIVGLAAVTYATDSLNINNPVSLPKG